MESEPVVAATTTTSGQNEDLIGGTWLVTAATGTGRNPKDFPARLRFSPNGDGTGTVALSGCDVATFRVQFGPAQVLTIGPPINGIQGCANPLDVGQAMSNILALPLRWSVVGNELTLTPTTPSAYSLVLMKE